MAITVLDNPATAPVETDRPFAACESATDVARWLDTHYRAHLEGGAPPPWMRTTGPHPALVAWLNVEAPSLVRPGSRVVVAGCGCGAGCDVVELLGRGYDVLGIDPAPAAIELVKTRHRLGDEALRCADLAEPPARLRHRFDLTVGISLLASTPPTLRTQMAKGLVEITHPRGAILLIEPGGEPLNASAVSPPAPLRPDELTGLMDAAGFPPTRAPDDFEMGETPPGRWLRGVFRRG